MDITIKTQLLELLVKVAAPVAVALGTALAGWVGIKASQWMHAKAEDAKNSTATKLWWGAMEQLTYFVSLGVQEVEATLRPQFKAATADGTITPAEAQQLRQAAIDAAKKYASDKGLALIATKLGIDASGVDALIGSLVEKVHAGLGVKEEPAAVPS